jgi:hydroxyethylthiazole kinase-like uncharacterized protein yjeF
VIPAHETAVVRSAEAAANGTHGDAAMMRRASFGLATVLAAELHARTGGVAGRAVVLLVGSGGNGGDALWAGAFLARRGVAVTAVLLVPDRAHPAGLAALLRSGGRVGTEVLGADLVVDGIVGLSARGPLRPAAAALVDQVRSPVVAVDSPSGVDPDTGVSDGPAVSAAVTVTFGGLKPVHLLNAGACGRTVVVDMPFALPPARLGALSRTDVGALWPVPGAADDKYTQGVVGVVAGSATYPGAAVLCTGAAVTSTSGMVRYAGSGREAVLARFPEVVAVDEVADAGRVQAWVAGPGLGTGAHALGVLRHVLDSDVPVLLDADAITVVGEHPELLERPAPTLLTPHAGEFARLTGSAPTADRVASVRAASAELGVTLLLKGATTIVADRDGRVLVNPATTSWVSTAGAGDLLSGLVGALLAAGLDPLHAAAAGAHVHVLAAELAAVSAGTGAPVSASPVLEHLRAAVRTVRRDVWEDQWR